MNIRRIIRRVYLRFHEAVYPDIGEDRPADDSRQFTSRPLVYHPSIRLSIIQGRSDARQISLNESSNKTFTSYFKVLRAAFASLYYALSFGCFRVSRT